MITEINLPFPVSVNAIWRNGRRTHKSERYKIWRRAAMNEIQAQRPKKIKGKFKISIDLCRPDKRKRDLDNYAKAILDVLEHMNVIENDSLCDGLFMTWGGQQDGATVSIKSLASGELERAA